MSVSFKVGILRCTRWLSYRHTPRVHFRVARTTLPRCSRFALRLQSVDLKASPGKSNAGDRSLSLANRLARSASMCTRTERRIDAGSAAQFFAVPHQQSFAQQTLHQHELTGIIEFTREIAHHKRRPRQGEIHRVPYK